MVINPDAAAIERGVHIQQPGRTADLAAGHRARRAEGAAARGRRRPGVERTFYTLDGKMADLAKVRQNDRLVVSIEGYNEDRGYHQVALLDLLPAGFEIESVVNKRNGEELPVPAERSPAPASPRRATTASSPPSTSAASPTARGGKATRSATNDYRFHVAYIVRAVTPGSFALPAVHVSDMYAPRVFGRTAMGHVTIAPR